jgi:hypothetical protein
MAKKPAPINLIKVDQNELVNQVINWALTIGRVLIIIVEIIALSAFIYRFILDNQLRDINSRIQQDQSLLSLKQQREATFRNLQDRLYLEASIVNQGQEKVKLVKDIIGFATPGISFMNVDYSKNQVIIQLNTTSVFPLSVFIDSLKNYPLTDSISIDLINNHSDTANIEVDLTVNLKNGGGNNEISGN